EADLLGKSAEWLIHPDDRERSTAERGHLAAGRLTVHFDSRLRHKDGSYRWISWKAVPEGGRVYAMGRDVTDLKEAENAARDARADLARVTRQTTLAAMTASIAHEVSQPLSAMIVNAEVGVRWLSREVPDLEEVRTSLTRIVDDGNRASDVIASIRGMHRKDDHERSALNVNDLVGEILAIVHGELDAHQVVVQRDLAEGLPAIVGERVPLQQVLLNLIMNAAEAMSAVTGRQRLLTAKSQAIDANDVLITFADSGEGIRPEHMERIFEAFFTTKSQGMGMGLSICRLIVRGHGGQLWAEPATPHGTIFHVRLPGEAGGK